MGDYLVVPSSQSVAWSQTAKKKEHWVVPSPPEVNVHVRECVLSVRANNKGRGSERPAAELSPLDASLGQSTTAATLVTSACVCALACVSAAWAWLQRRDSLALVACSLVPRRETMATTPARITRNALKNMADGDDAKERLLHEYQTFQHGLAPVKRRRVSSQASETSEASVSTTHEPTTTAESPTGASVASADERPLPKQKLSTESVAELELANDEKALDGAPEGELYVVNVLTRDEFQPAVDADAEVAEVNEVVETKQAAGEESKSDAEEQLSWAKEYAAIDSLRRIAIHHADRLPELTKEALPVLVCPAASSLRSAMARNALLCIQDIVLALKSECDGFLNQVIPLLLHRTANEKQFIRDLARDVLTSCIDCCPNDALLRELLRISTTEKNAQVVSSAGVHASTCIEKMEKAHVKAFALSHESLVEELSAFLNCKVVECKVATRKTLQYLRKTVGDAEFTTLVKEKLQGSAQVEVLKASEERKKPAPVKSGLPRLSMRERMMQMKKQQAAKGEDDVVVVAAPPPPSSTTR